MELIVSFKAYNEMHAWKWARMDRIKICTCMFVMNKVNIKGELSKTIMRFETVYLETYILTFKELTT